jgi:hypothetical protein
MTREQAEHEMRRMNEGGIGGFEIGKLPDVRAVVERFGQRFRLQDMDALNPLPSGLTSVPRVVAER